MTSFASLSITPFVCNAASKLNGTTHKNSTCYQLTTETVKCTAWAVQRFQNKRSSHWMCSIKEVLRNFAIFTGKHLRQSLFLITFQATSFHNRTRLGDCFWNKFTCQNLKAKLFNLRILASFCNFNYLQIFVKARITVVKFNCQISIIYHQIKFLKGIINWSSIKIPLLKISQHSHRNNCVGICV